MGVVPFLATRCVGLCRGRPCSFGWITVCSLSEGLCRGGAWCLSRCPCVVGEGRWRCYCGRGGVVVFGWVVIAGFVGWLKLIVCEVIRIFVIAILCVMCDGSFPWCYYDHGREDDDGRLYKERMNFFYLFIRLLELEPGARKELHLRVGHSF